MLILLFNITDFTPDLNVRSKKQSSRCNRYLLFQLIRFWSAITIRRSDLPIKFAYVYNGVEFQRKLSNKLLT